jgi:CDP-diacylglycerol--serine O-phosphatidyltransferase
LFDGYYSNYFLALYILSISLLAVSRIPTFSTKAFKIEKNQINLILGFFIITVVGLLVIPWVLLPIFAGGYLLSIPISYFYYRRKNFF